MIVDGCEIVDAERAGKRLARPAGTGVDDRGRSAQLVQPPDERPQARFLAVDELDVVAQVGPDDARAHDLRLAAEGSGDLALRRRRGGRGHAEDRRTAERVQGSPDEEVVGPEVVPPHAHAVHLVDHDEPDVDPGDRLEEAARAQTLRRDVEQAVAALGDTAEARRRLVRVERGVDQRRLRRDLGRELVELILHQRDQGAEDERRRRPQHRRELVGERLAGAGRHQRERVAAVDGRTNDGLLAGPEVLESEQPCQRGLELAHAITVRSGSERTRHAFVTGSATPRCSSP